MKNDRVYILRESVVKITQMLSGKGIKVTQQGVNAYVKADHNGTPVLVNLPYLPDNATEDLCNAIQGFLDHEVAHILFTTFNVMGKAMKQGRQVAFLLNALEDPRIEKCMAERFQGCAYNLAVTGKFYLDKFVVPKMQEAAKAGKAHDVINALMVPMIRAMSGQTVFQEFMKDKWTIVEPVYERIKDLAPQIEAAASTEDCLKLAEEISKRLSGEKSEGAGEGKGGSGGKKAESAGGKAKAVKGEKPEKSEKGKGAGKADKSMKPEEDEPGAGGSSEKDEKGKPKDEEDDKSKGAGKEEEKEKDEEEEKAPSTEDDKKDEDKSPSAGEPKEDEPEEDEPDVKASDEEDEAPEEDAPDDDEDGAEMGEGNDAPESDVSESRPIWEELDKDGVNGYDESMSRVITQETVKAAGDADYLVFTKEHDVIEKLPIGSGYDAKMTQRLIEAVDHMVAPLQKDLERAVAARSLVTRSHGHRSGRLHASNLTRLHFNDDRVFSRKHESESKDVAVELVVDASGSMSGSKIHTACQSAYALSAVLDRLSIKNEVICFTTKGIGGLEKEMHEQQMKLGIRFSRTEGIYMPILKGYDERMTAQVKERFGWLPNTRILRSNVDGESIEVAARRLLQRREHSKVMIVLSDGYPAAAGSGNLHAHLKKTAREIEKAGVRLVGIGIESDAVRDFYSKNLVLHSVNDLPAVVIKELRHLLMV